MEAPAEPAATRTLRLALLAIACITYAGIALTSPGYDDEYYNIGLIEMLGSIGRVVDYTQHLDIHPPGQFALDGVLFAMLGSWPLVRMLGGLATALTVFRFAELEKIRGRGAVILHFILVVIHPTLLMWCTGVRWTSWFVPIFLIAILWIRRDRPGRWTFWPVLALLCLLLMFLNYGALLLVPLLVLLGLWTRRDRLRQDWPPILASGAAAAPFALFQFYYLLHFQLQLAGHYFTPPVRAIAGVPQGLMIHAGVFPLSFIGIVTLIAFVALTGILAWRHREVVRRDPEIWFIAAGVLLMLVTGISGKPRDLIALVPLTFVKFVPLLQRGPARIGFALAWVLALSNLYGAFNVARHQDTAKGSWNLPVAETIAAVKTAAAACPGGKPAIAVLDQVLAANLATHTDFTVMGPRRMPIPEPMLRDGDYCLIQVVTWRGSIPEQYYTRIQQHFPPPIAPPVKIGPDRYARYKQWIDGQVPDHYVAIVSYGRVRRVPDYMMLVEKRDRAAKMGLKRAYEIGP